jgi:hypothetical protein
MIISNGILRVLQYFSLGCLILSVAKYGITSLNIHGYLIVIVIAEGVDRLGRIITLMGSRDDDYYSFLMRRMKNRNYYPREPPIDPAIIPTESAH